MNIEITNNFERHHLEAIKGWLKAEEEKFDGGFYCNWSIIEQCFEDNEMYCAMLNGRPVAFLVYSTYMLCAEISIVETRPDLRGKGIGMQLVMQFLDDLKDNGIVKVKLESNPPDSLPFWKKLGFVRHPEQQDRSPFMPQKLFKVLIEGAGHATNEDREVVEIWDTEWFRKIDSRPSKSFTISRNNDGKMTKPIILIPYSPSQRLRWKNGNQVLYDGPMEGIKSRVPCGGALLLVPDL